MNNTKKIAVVTGGVGFIGSHLVNILLESGYTVKVIDSLIAGKRESVPSGVDFFKVDTRDYESLLPIFADADCVFHLAALPAVGYSIEHPRETHDVNVTGLVNVISAAKAQHVRKMIFASSSAIYGDHKETPLHEDLAPILLSPYALHKHIGEEYLALSARLYGIETVSLRFFNVYGPGFDPDGAYAAVIGRFIKLSNEGKPLTVVGDGEQTRDFVHVKDVARALILAAEADTARNGEVINIGTGIETSVNTLADFFGGERAYLPPRIEPYASRADITKARTLINWIPEIKFAEGIAGLVNQSGNS